MRGRRITVPSFSHAVENTVALLQALGPSVGVALHAALVVEDDKAGSEHLIEIERELLISLRYIVIHIHSPRYPAHYVELVRLERESDPGDRFSKPVVIGLMERFQCFKKDLWIDDDLMTEEFIRNYREEGQLQVVPAIVGVGGGEYLGSKREVGDAYVRLAGPGFRVEQELPVPTLLY